MNNDDFETESQEGAYLAISKLITEELFGSLSKNINDNINKGVLFLFDKNGGNAAEHDRILCGATR